MTPDDIDPARRALCDALVALNRAQAAVRQAEKALEWAGPEVWTTYLEELGIRVGDKVEIRSGVDERGNMLVQEKTWGPYFVQAIYRWGYRLRRVKADGTMSKREPEGYDQPPKHGSIHRVD